MGLFDVHRLNARGLARATDIGAAFEATLIKLEELCPEGRALAIVRTKMQEACFFAKRAMAEDKANQEAL